MEERQFRSMALGEGGCEEGRGGSFWSGSFWEAIRNSDLGFTVKLKRKIGPDYTRP